LEWRIHKHLSWYFHFLYVHFGAKGTLYNRITSGAFASPPLHTQITKSQNKLIGPDSCFRLLFLLKKLADISK